MIMSDTFETFTADRQGTCGLCRKPFNVGDEIAGLKMLAYGEGRQADGRCIPESSRELGDWRTSDWHCPATNKTNNQRSSNGTHSGEPRCSVHRDKHSYVAKH